MFKIPSKRSHTTTLRATFTFSLKMSKMVNLASFWKKLAVNQSYQTGQNWRKVPKVVWFNSFKWDILEDFQTFCNLANWISQCDIFWWILNTVLIDCFRFRCRDYVTEQFFNMHNLNMIPVVLGGANYSAIAPPHSFIDAADFPKYVYTFTLL